MEINLLAPKLTEREFHEGSLLNPQQLKVLQYNLVVTSQEKINLTYTPNEPLIYAQQEADLTGKLSMLNYILSCHEAAEEYFKQQAAIANQQQ